tara:strand:+ start:418 stop:1080 length:663 start_codon:yes stop_codon:yes gene_type:complete
MIKKIIKKNKEEAAKTVVYILKKSIKKLLQRQQKVILAIPGGRSIKSIFKLLKEEKLPYKQIHLFWVDERLVPLTHKDSNFKLVKPYLSNFPKGNIHSFNYKEGFNKYSKELKNLGERFDIVLLSSGEDGHIASLFPHHHTIMNGNEFFISTDSSPKPPKNRMSSSKNLISRSKISILLFLGESKRDALDNFNNNKTNVKDCPAKLIKLIRQSYLITDLK